MDVGVPELLIVLVVILVIFGGAKIPQLARSLGQAHTEFKKGAEHGLAGPDATVPADPTPTATPTPPDGPPEMN